MKQLEVYKMYDFNQDLNDKCFEKIFAEYFLDNYTVTNGYFPGYDVIDKDVDLTFEVKRDYWYHKTKNLLIEEYFNVEAGEKGWIYYTNADFLVVFVDSFTFYIIPMADVKFKWFYRNKLKIEWVKKDIEQKDEFTTRNWVTLLDKHFSPLFFNIDKEMDGIVIC